MRKLSRKGRRRISQHKFNRIVIRMRAGLASTSDVASLPYYFLCSLHGSNFEVPMYHTEAQARDAATICMMVTGVVFGF